MEAFGRTIALVVGMIGVVFLLLFSKTASVRWQRQETVRSMSHAFAETLLRDKKVLFHEWVTFQKELQHLGSYRAELTVYERRRFEDERGGYYLYRKAELTDDKILGEGSYVRVLVTPVDEAENDEMFMLGDYGVIVAGGRVQ